MRPESGQKAPSKFNPATFKRVAKSFEPYKDKVWLTVVLIIVSIVLGILPAWFLRTIIDDGFRKHNVGLVALYSLYTVIVTLAASVTTYIYGYVSADVGQRILRDFRNKLFTHLQGMSLRFFTSTRTGEIQSRLMSDVSGVQTVLSDVITNALSNIGFVVASVIGMFIFDWRLTLLAIGLIPIFGFMSSWIGEYARKIRKGTQEQTAELNSLMQETLSVSGILLTKTSGRRSLVEDKFLRENQKLADFQLRSQMLGYLFFGLIRLVFSITPVLTYWLAAYFPGISIGTLFAFTTLQARMFFPLSAIMSVQIELTSSLALFDRIFDYLDRPQEITDRENPLTLAPSEVKGEVKMEQVEFRYDPESETPTLHDITFVSQPGTLTALVGPSGAGKTTLTYLVARLYDVDQGSVKIDGHDIRDIKLSCVEQFVGAVTQETYLVHDTIRENLRYAKPDASEAEIEEATRAAAIYDHIVGLPDGFDTVVGERGYKLSGGEKQRLAIARAILKDPRILILDEATSSLDSQSERTIQASLNKLMEGRTTFAIAHRLSTILAADQILVVENGQIVQHGTHAELVGKPGLYNQLYTEQFSVSPELSPA